MGQPNPPGDMPLFEGLGVEWNDIVSAFPEDRRAELAPKLKERLSSYEPLKQWEDFQKSGISPDHARTALNLFSTIENNPREVYDTIGKYLNITPDEAKEVVKELEDADQDDPRIAALTKQVETLSQIALAQRQMTAQEQRASEADAALERDLDGLKKKYGNDIPEDEIIMRMMHKDLTAEQAYQEYSTRAAELQRRRPAPYIMGQGGHVPNNAIDVKKLDNSGTKKLVQQMIEHANVENNR